MQISRKSRTSATLLFCAGIAFSTLSSAAGVSIVLVHGVLTDGSSWRGVYDLLTRDGYSVSIVQQPLTGFEDDVAATQRILNQQTEPVVLVGHSYGGAIITAAGVDPKVKALVYVAAIQPDVGENSGEVAPPMQPASNDLRQSDDGFVSLDRSKFIEDFCADVPKKDALFMAHAQMPVSSEAFKAKLSQILGCTESLSDVQSTVCDRDVRKRNSGRCSSPMR